MQQYQRTVDNWSVWLIVSVGHLEPEKLSWYHIQWVWTNGKPSMLLSENAGNIWLEKRNGEQVAIKKLIPNQYKKVMGAWKNPLRYMTKHEMDMKNKIQKCNKLLKIVTFQERISGQLSGKLCGKVLSMWYKSQWFQIMKR